MLSDSDITYWRQREELDIEPYNPDLLGPCSYDVTLGDSYTYLNTRKGLVDPLRPPSEQYYEFFQQPRIALEPKEFLLGHTNEVVTLGDNVAAQLEGKSSLGRLGLLVHVTAGFIDPGFSGQITLELHNVSENPILLTAGMPIGQLVFHQLDTLPTQTYMNTGRYNKQMGPTISKGVKL